MKCYIINPYGASGGGKVSQAGLELAINQTFSFKAVESILVEGNINAAKAIFGLIKKINAEEEPSSNLIIVQGIFPIAYLLFDFFLKNEVRLMIIPRGSFIPKISEFSFVRRPIMKIIFWNFLLKKRFEKCSAWVCTSELEQQRLISVGAKKSNSVVIPDMFDGEMRFPIDEPASSSIEQYILYVGRLAKEKNLIFLINVFFRLKKYNNNAKLVLLGPIVDKQYYRRIKAEIGKYNLEKSIYVIITVEQKQIPYYYKNAACVVLPSYIESLGLTILEAAYYAKFSFVSTGTPWNNLDPAIGVQLDFDVDIWATKINQFLNRDTFSIPLQTANRFLNNYTLESVAEEWKKIISKIMI